MGQGEKSAPDHNGSDQGLLPALETGGKGKPKASNSGERTKCTKTITIVHVLAVFTAVLLIAIATLIVIIAGRKISDCQRLLNDVNGDEHLRTNIPLHPPCPQMWIWYLGKCYNFSKEEGDWTSCNDICASWNSTLSVIETDTELDFLKNHKGTYEYWIGLKQGSDGMWRTVNGTIFKKWFTIRGDSACAYLNGKGVSSSRCHTIERCLCSKRDDYTDT